MTTLRVLAEQDLAALEAFLARHRDSSMFLRSNLRRSGLTYRPEPFHANYVGAFEDEHCIAAAAHCWNGMLLLQAPDHTEKLSQACVAHSGRRITGFSGPLRQVQRSRMALGLADAAALKDSDESLYGMDLQDLVLPEILNREIQCRAPRPEERDVLCDWRIAYAIETLGDSDTEETRQRATAFLDQQLADGNVWVAINNGRLVSMSAFNASLPDIVQLGGIYTPPEFRGRGYAKAAVAASLIAAEERGVTRAVLFTSNPSAVRSYEAVGFRYIDEFGLILLS